MPTLKLNSNGKLILKNGKASCECCGGIIQGYFSFQVGGISNFEIETLNVFVLYEYISANDYEAILEDITFPFQITIVMSDVNIEQNYVSVLSLVKNEIIHTYNFETFDNLTFTITVNEF